MSEYRRRLWRHVWQEAVRSHSPTHLLWALIPLVISTAVGFFLFIKWGPHTFSLPLEIGIPLLTGVIGALLTFGLYIVWYRLRAPRKLWETSQKEICCLKKRIAELEAAPEEPNLSSEFQFHNGVAEFLLQNDGATTEISA